MKESAPNHFGLHSNEGCGSLLTPLAVFDLLPMTRPLVPPVGDPLLPLPGAPKGNKGFPQGPAPALPFPSPVSTSGLGVPVMFLHLAAQNSPPCSEMGVLSGGEGPALGAQH